MSFRPPKKLKLLLKNCADSHSGMLQKYLSGDHYDCTFVVADGTVDEDVKQKVNIIFFRSDTPQADFKLFF